MVDIKSMRSALKILDKYIKDYPRHICIGNHELRVHKFEEKIPEIQGMMKNVYMIALKILAGHIQNMENLSI